MKVPQLVGGAALVALASFTVLTRRADAAVLIATGLALSVATFTLPDRRHQRGAVPLLMFAVALAAAELAWNRKMPVVALRAVTVFLASNAVVHLLPWAGLIGRTRPGSVGWTLVLFLLFTRHFVVILQAETGRIVRAWQLSAPRRFGPRGLSSLPSVLLSIVGRAWARAEHFHAAQHLRGF